MRTADELRDAVEAYLRALPLHGELAGLEDVLRYSLGSGGKRIRPVLCLAVAEAAGADGDDALPGACALELVHTFSLVHDDLPAMDDDDERRGRPSAHVAFGEGAAILGGDALLAEAFRLALTYETNAVAVELADATLAMIAGQYRDISSPDDDLEELHRLKTGRLFVASVRIGLEVAHAPPIERADWMRFGDAVGLLFQAVDDLLDGDGYVSRVGRSATEGLAKATALSAQAALAGLSADTRILEGLVATLAGRTG